jgi:nicotinamide phosphoribosyltransferase
MTVKSPAYDVRVALFPRAMDMAYTQENQLIISLILRADSYKFSHPFAYKPGIKGQAAYGEARTAGEDVMVPFGMQILLKRYLSQKITMADVLAAEAFALEHGVPFAKEDWVYIVENYDGRIPLTIRTVREGTPVPSGNAIYTVICIDDRVFWLAAYFETLIQRGIWYPTTIASMDAAIKAEMKHLYEVTGANMDTLPFALHDFGARGVTCGEQAEIGGAAHLVNFMGSDTVEGVLAANFYYKHKMAAFSVAASEHAVECSFHLDDEGEIAYLDHMLKTFAKPGKIVSIVIDGKDVYRCAKYLCTVFKDRIIASGAKVVFRPDSGDMMEVVPRLLKMQEDAFGITMSAKGFKSINYVGVIQGDGVDHLAIRSLLGKVIYALGYTADVVVFGSGGALLQKVNRDTFKFAQKASSVLLDDEDGNEYWDSISKDPITDPGKKSKEGILTLARHKFTGEYSTVRIDQEPLSDELDDVMVLVYHNGTLYNEINLDTVRTNASRY